MQIAFLYALSSPFVPIYLLSSGVFINTADIYKSVYCQ